MSGHRDVHAGLRGEHGALAGEHPGRARDPVVKMLDLARTRSGSCVRSSARCARTTNISAASAAC
ncbi:hypothetical protein [Nocardia araoensis]|uniref:hypothetical protein n=1 Tax=Nocardia araoensis TaxID=228600 RepID=UPI0002E81772|nr:hypothetical protein [Nocardia araoensis]